MRLIVIFLVAINVAVFAYAQFMPAPAAGDAVSLAEQSAPSVTDYRSLALMSENLPQGNRNEQPIQNAIPSRQASAPICTLVGPFEKLLSAEYFVERLLALEMVSEIKNITVAGDSGYWLHLSPEASRQEALRRLRELQQKNIDSYIIPSGDLANGISLGMFSNADRARDMQDNIKKLGYEPEIIAISRDQQEVWIYLPQGEASKLAENRWLELLSSEESLQKRQNLCSDVASL